MIKQIGVQAVLLVAILFVATRVNYIQDIVQIKRPLEKSPVTYSELIPEKDEYMVGDLISFTYDRTCAANDKDLPLLMLTTDSFENLDTGEVFTATPQASRTVKKNGTDRLKATRRLSTDCSPGTYSFEGWVSIQGPLMVEPVPYSSRKFKVLLNPNG